MIVPSKTWNDALEFINGVKPPMMLDITFEIVGDDEGLECFKGNGIQQSVSFLLVTITLLITYLFV